MRIVRGNQSGLVIPLKERSYLLGRAISHEDVGPGRIYFHDPTVALLQARLRWDETLQEYVVSQETSSSRSSVSGLPLTRGATLSLRRGSRLKLGNLILLIEDANDAAPKVAPERPPEATPQPEPPPPAPLESSEDTVEAVPLVQVDASERVDASWFRVKMYTLRPTDVLHGPVAEFFGDGQLKRLAVYHQGIVSTSHNQLLLEQRAPAGRVFSDFSECVYSGGQETVMTNIDGEIDLFEEEVEWRAWVQKWIDQICGNQAVSVLPTPVQALKA